MNATNSEVAFVTGSDNFLTQLPEIIRSRANVSTVFGEPIVRDRTTVVPIAQVRWGIGGGGGRRRSQSEPESGFGGGGGMVVNPVGYLEIDESGAKYHSAGGRLNLLTGVLAGLLVFIALELGFRKNR
ncbi:MAG TPA: spore germination protein GerW family protein [Bryobacteraceae bacterium]|jgi:uncharacterized spore protein YtfJ|nr:spore germination protein GerW family protein [Bryobacteraceae bacterium]